METKGESSSDCSKALTKGVEEKSPSCLICLASKTDGDGADEHGGVHNGVLTKLRNVFRFLELETKTKSTKWKVDPGLRVSLCSNCSKVMGKFDSLYQSLEETKLRLNECIRIIYGSMKGATTDSGGGDGDPLKDVRENLLEKCAAQIGTVQPRISLTRCKIPKRKKRIVKARNGYGTKKSNLKRNILPPTTLTKLNHRPGPLSQLSRKKRHELVKCPHCDKFSGDKTYFLKLHLVRYHSELYFIDYKDASVSDEEFKHFVSHLLFKDLVVQQSSAGEYGRDSCSCPYCPNLFSYRRQRGFLPLKLHMIEQHSPELVAKLMEIQTSSNLLEKPEGQKSPRRLSRTTLPDSSKKITKKAVKIVQRRGGPKRNVPKPSKDTVSAQTSSEPEHRPSKSDKNSAEPPFAILPKATSSLSTSVKGCPYCRAVITTGCTRSLRIHILRFHCNKLFNSEDLKIDSISMVQFQKLLYHLLFANVNVVKTVKDQITCSCPYCSKLFTYRNKESHIQIRLHMIEKHHKMLERRVIELQEDPELIPKLELFGTTGMTCGTCESYLPNHTSYDLHKKKFCGAPRASISMDSSQRNKIFGRKNRERRRVIPKSQPIQKPIQVPSKPKPKKRMMKKRWKLPKTIKRRKKKWVGDPTLNLSESQPRIRCNKCDAIIHPTNIARHQRLLKCRQVFQLKQRIGSSHNFKIERECPEPLEGAEEEDVIVDLNVNTEQDLLDANEDEEMMMMVENEGMDEEMPRIVCVSSLLEGSQEEDPLETGDPLQENGSASSQGTIYTLATDDSRNEAGRSFKCEYCWEVFASKSVFTAHKIRHIQDMRAREEPVMPTLTPEENVGPTSDWNWRNHSSGMKRNGELGQQRNKIRKIEI